MLFYCAGNIKAIKGIKFTAKSSDVYGLGEKTTLKKAKNSELSLWNTGILVVIGDCTDAYKYTPETDLLYGSYPFVLLCNRDSPSTAFSGIFVDNHSMHKWRLEDDSIQVLVER